MPGYQAELYIPFFVLVVRTSGLVRVLKLTLKLVLSDR